DVAGGEPAVDGDYDPALGREIGKHLGVDAAGGDDLDFLVRLARAGMAYRDDRLDVGVACRQRLADRHRLRAHRRAPDIGVEVKPGMDLARARAQRRTDRVAVLLVAVRSEERR